MNDLELVKSLSRKSAGSGHVTSPAACDWLYNTGVPQMRAAVVCTAILSACPWHNSRSNGKSISKISGYGTARRLRNIPIIIEKV